MKKVKFDSSVEFELVSEFKKSFIKVDAEPRMLILKKKEDEILDKLCGAPVYFLRACKNNRYQFYEKESVRLLIDKILENRKK